MANVLNKTADPVDYRTSVNTPDYPTADWFIDPDVSAVAAVPTKYWARPLTDPVTEMTQPEKDAVDAAEAAALTNQNRADAVANVDNTEESVGWELRELIELFNKRDNYIVNRMVEIQDTLVAIRDQTFGTQARQNIDAGFPTLATSTRTRAQAVQDYKDDINAGGADT